MLNEQPHHWMGPLAAVLAPYIVFQYLIMNSALDPKIVAPNGHFYIVSSVALLATIVALVVGVSGRRLRNIQVTFLAMAFLSLAEVFAIHGLATPGFILKSSHVPGIAAQMSILLTAIWLWLSAQSSDHRIVVLCSSRQEYLVPIWGGILAVVGIVALFLPHSAQWIPLDQNPVKWLVTAVILGLNFITIRRYWLSYRYTRFPLQLSIVYSIGWLSLAQIIIVTGESWKISWWIYHFLLLAAMIVMLVGLVRQYSRTSSVGNAVRALFNNDPVERIESGISPSVRALLIAAESRDRYTAGHNFRVALYAIRLGDEIGLSPEQLRALAQGGVVHDIGKMQVPDSILNKPDKLTPDERTVIERHPVEGYEMCKKLGFMKEELEVIRNHHEKWDGSGYPDRLKGEDIPILARILAVTDVYDALTSSRSYRKAWSHEDGIQWIKGQAGTHFDPACVQAWERVCAQGPVEYRQPTWILRNDG